MTVQEDDIVNAKQKESVTQTCPSCGGKLIFSPQERALKCEYCGGKVNVDFSKHGEELDFYNLLTVNNNTWSNDTHVIQCKNCGAKTVISKTEINKTCPFCGTSNVVRTDELCGLKPNAVLPFTLTADDACESVKKWVKKKLYAPRKFKKNVQPKDISGSYTPAFTFDTSTVTTYRGELGKIVTKTYMVNGQRVTKSYTEYFKISGTFSWDFDDVLVHASNQISQRNIDKLSPFDTNNSNEYSTEFLHGYSATQYTKNGEQCWEYAKKVMQAEIRQQILSKYDYDEEKYLTLNVTYNEIKYKYVLIPVYIGHCSFAKKLYNFFVNGRSGRVTGKTPVSAVKVLITVFSALAAIVGIVLFFYLKVLRG